MKEYDFYIVPTPIGNLADITIRALNILKSVDIIACEDMRVTQKLLNHYDIKTKCISYHKFNERERIDYFLYILKTGKKIALVSDAGTPLFCDPGSVIVEELRKNNFTLTSLPGANAVATFLSQIPRKHEDFVFVGFIPRIQSQIESLICKFKHTDLVFYDSPNRILNTLEIIKNLKPGTKIALGRELSKVFEEVIIDDIENVINYYKTNPIKGEIAALVFRENEECEFTDIAEKINLLKSKGFKAKEISVILSELYELNKNKIYKLCIDLPYR